MRNSKHIDKDSDLWETPECLMRSLNNIFKFDIDLCATKDNTKIKKFSEDIFSIGDLTSFKNAFMNPPYSNVAPFIRKAWQLSKDCQIVCLVPSSIKTCRYMDFLDDMEGTSNFRMWRRGVIWQDLTKRTKFTHPTKKASSPSFGCSILILNNPGD